MKFLWALLFLATSAFGAGKDFIPPNLIVTNCAMTGAATCTSTIVDVRGFDNIGLQANWTGTPTGTFYVDVSEDYNPNTGNAGLWNTLAVTLTAPAGSASHAYLDAIQTAAAYIRVRYVNSASTGVLNVYLGSKAL